MPSTPKKPPDTTVRKMYRLVAYVAADGNSAVTDDDESTEWQVVDITKEAGGLLEATLIRDLGAIGKHLEDRRITERQNLQTEIWLLDTKGERLHALFAGDMLISTLRLDPASERETVVCRLAPFHYGSILEGQRVWDPLGAELITVHYDAEFNPEIDGVLVNNRRKPDKETTGVDWSTWVDPESIRTETAARWGQDLILADDVAEWTVADAVETLQGWLNPNESFVRNFRRRDQSQIAKKVWRDAPPRLENVELPRGLYLPALLDRLLPRHGFHFVTDVSADERTGSKRATPRIRIFKRGEGEEKQLKLQKRQQSLDRTKSNTDMAEVVIDLSTLANVVTCHGALEEREVTIPLYRAWPEADDNLAADELDPKNPDSLYVGHEDAWRKFVGNEAGDHCKLRDIVEFIPAIPLDLTGVFSEWRYRRRFLEDCLTYRDGAEFGVRRPVFVEWSDDGGATWLPVPESWGYRVLTHEIGIAFNDTPPEDLVAAGDQARIRVTGTIRGDRRLRKRASLQPVSPVNLDVELFLDVSDRFVDRKRQTTGDLASVLTGDADERDDGDALQAFATAVQGRSQSAVIRATIGLPGIQLGYQVSDILTEIDGRKISFDRNTKASGESRYIQIVGLKWDNLQQRTFLTVEPFDR